MTDGVHFVGVPEAMVMAQTGAAANGPVCTAQLLESAVSGSGTPAGHGGGANRGREKRPQFARRHSCFKPLSAGTAWQRATVVAQMEAEAKASTLQAGAAA